MDDPVSTQLETPIKTDMFLNRLILANDYFELLARVKIHRIKIVRDRNATKIQ